MAVPGLSSALLMSGRNVFYSTSQNDVDPWVDAGSPSSAVIANIFVGAGVVIGASLPSGPAMYLRFPTGSVVNIFVAGKIGAAGGHGGGGDRGRRNSNPSSTFVGGGGGGGAGTEPGPGGARAVEPDPDAATASDGSPGTATTGGLAGSNDFGSDIPNSIVYTPGSVINRIAYNPAILIWPVDGSSFTVNIWNGGSIFAGGNGGLGGFQDAGLPGGANLPEDGEDLPAYADLAPGVGVTDHPAIWSRQGQVTLNLKSGTAHPSIKGRVVTSSVLPS